MYFTRNGAIYSLLVVASLLMLNTTSGYSQAITTAAVRGTVQDETAAVIPGATITVINEDTGLTRTGITDGEGRFRVPNLQPGTYQIRGELVGFKTVVRRGITLAVQDDVMVNLTLEIGEVSEEVVVTGAAPLVSTTRGSMGELVESKTIAELPLNGRDLAQLIVLQTGALNAKNNSQGQGQWGKDDFSSGCPSNGQRFFAGWHIRQQFY